MENQFFVDSEFLSLAALEKKHRLENDPSSRKNHMEYLPGMEQISSDVCARVMAQMESYDPGRYTARDVKAALEPVGVRVREQICRFDDETVIRMVGRGLGVSMMSELMIRGRTDDVLCVPVDPPARRELGMGTHLRRPVSGEVRKLKDCILEFIGEHAGSNGIA